MKLRTAVIALVLSAVTIARAQSPDSQKLGMALDYFQSGKYHETLLILEQLDKQYRLNPRFRAYLGVCYYHEWDYKNACKYLDELMPQLEVFAPHERSVYYFANAESHFFLQQYDKAIPLYEKMLLVCYDNEKADALFRIAFCYLSKEDYGNAYEFLCFARDYYQTFPNENKVARLEQIKTMIDGCEEKLKDKEEKLKEKEEKKEEEK